MEDYRVNFTFALYIYQEKQTNPALNPPYVAKYEHQVPESRSRCFSLRGLSSNVEPKTTIRIYVILFSLLQRMKLGHDSFLPHLPNSFTDYSTI